MTEFSDASDPGDLAVSGAKGRMVAIHHEGPLPWLQLRNAAFHPVIFRKMIGRTDPAAKNGDLVRVYDREGKVFGTGMLNTQSQIGVRMLTFDARPVDEAFIHDQLRGAIALRRDVLKAGSGQRCLPAGSRGGGWPAWAYCGSLWSLCRDRTFFIADVQAGGDSGRRYSKRRLPFGRSARAGGRSRVQDAEGVCDECRGAGRGGQSRSGTGRAQAATEYLTVNPLSSPKMRCAFSGGSNLRP